MEVLRCPLAHNRCHNLNYYYQSFTPPVKQCSNLSSLFFRTNNLFFSLLHCLNASVFRCQAHQHTQFPPPPSPVTHLEHMAALHYEREFNKNICRSKNDTTNPNRLSLFPTSYSVDVFHVLCPTCASSLLPSGSRDKTTSSVRCLCLAYNQNVCSHNPGRPRDSRECRDPRKCTCTQEIFFANIGHV